MTKTRINTNFLAALCLTLLFGVSPLAHATMEWTKKVAPSAPKALSDLPKLNIDRARITTSGVSSGAFMALQLHIAHSNLFSGAAREKWEFAVFYA